MLTTLPAKMAHTAFLRKIHMKLNQTTRPRHGQQLSASDVARKHPELFADVVYNGTKKYTTVFSPTNGLTRHGAVNYGVARSGSRLQVLLADVAARPDLFTLVTTPAPPTEATVSRYETPETETPETGQTFADLDTLTLAQLRDLATQLGLTGTFKSKKAARDAIRQV
jgi:hypothetical protein